MQKPPKTKVKKAARPPAFAARKAMNKAEIHSFFTRLRTQNPNPTTELVYHDAFTLLVAVILSAQATDKGVNKVTERLFATAPDAQKLYDLGVDGIRQHIASLNFYQNKARHLFGMAQMLLEKHQGEVPPDRDALQALPGVGRKTANVVLNTVFRQPTMAVDTHIFRLANRTGLARGKNVEEVEKALLRRVPAEFLCDAHHWLILHGRYICKARRPDCERCCVVDLCYYPAKP